jgi:hypothetical protein
MLMPSWKYSLNYETSWMSRDEIVAATYDGALRLLETKARHGLLEAGTARGIMDRIRRSRALMDRIDEACQPDGNLRREMRSLFDGDSICAKRELEWPFKYRKLIRPAAVMRRLLSAGA